MSVINLLDEMHARGELNKLIDAGIMSGSVALWRVAYHDYQKELQLTGSKMQAVSNAAENTGLSVRTLHYVRGKMEG
jgi:hypothetical protein